MESPPGVRRRVPLLTVPVALLPPRESDRIIADLPGADSDRVNDVDHEDLAVPGLAGVCRIANGVDQAVNEPVRHDDLELRLANEGVAGFPFRADRRRSQRWAESSWPCFRLRESTWSTLLT